MFSKSRKGTKSSKSSKSSKSKHAARSRGVNFDNESEGTGMSKGPQEWPARSDGNEGRDDGDQLQAEYQGLDYVDDPGQDHKTQYSHQPASEYNFPTSSPNEFPSSFYIPSPQTRQDQYVSGSSSYIPRPQRQQPQRFDYSCEDDSYQVPSSRDLGTSFGYTDTTYNTTPQQTSYQAPTAKSQLSSHSVNRNSSRFEHLEQDESFSEADEESGYMTTTNPGGYFKPGRIFRKKAEGANEDVQTFIVLQEGKDSATCAPLQNYDVDSSTYDYENESRPLVFATGITPQLGPGEGQPTMGQFPVFVEGSPDRIDPKSRLDFSAVLTIDHTAKVQTVGRIDRNYLKELKSTFLQAKGAELPYADLGPSEAGLSDSKWIGTTEDHLHVTLSMTEPLHPEFKVHPAKEFKFGRVFKVLWIEPKGQGFLSIKSHYDTEIARTKYGEHGYTSIRRFVIIKPLDGHCLCLPILTYQGQGTTKRGVKAQDHAVIYTKKKGQIVEEIANEEKLRKKPIRMEPSSSRNQLDQSSRLNYSKIYTVEYNVKVCFIGTIHEKSIKYFKRDYNLTHQPLPEAADAEFSDEEIFYSE